MFSRKIEPAWLVAFPLIWFVLIAGISLFAYGIDVDRFLTYNLFYSDIVFKPSKYDDPPLSLISQNQPIVLFHRVLSSILLNPVVNVWVAVCSIVIAMWIGSVALKTQSTTANAFFVILIVGLVAHGFFPGLDSSSLIFDRKSLVAFFLICAIYSLTRNSLVLFAIFVGVGTLLHPLDMVAGLIFVLPGYGLYVFFQRRTLFLRFVFFLGSFLLFVLLMRPEAGSFGSHLKYPIGKWYELVLLLEVGDVALFDLLGRTIGLNGVLIAFSTFIAVQNRSCLRLIDYWALTFGPIVALLVIFEGIQISGLTFGVISEMFISLQCRRGLWIVSVVALVHVLLFFFDRVVKDDRRTHVDLALVVSAVFLHSLIVMTVTVIFFMVLRRKEFGEKGGVILGAGLVLLIIQLLLQIDQLQLLPELQKLILFIGLTFAGTLLIKHSMQVAMLVLVSIYSGVLLANNNLRHEIFINSWSRVTQGSVDQGDQIVSVVSYDASERLHEQLDIVNALNQLGQGTNEGVLFASPVLGYAGPIVSDAKFIFSRWDNTLMVDRRLAALYIERLEDFGVDWGQCKDRKNEGTACFLDRIQSRIEELSEQEVLQLAQAYDVRFIVRETPMEIQPVYENSDLKIYDVLLLRK